ncbi:MAG: ribosomal protein S18-alanine N-acetyltransferase [Candidatus Aminicenantes bacterium]|nr:ribosomal protein S18-alanine N-acetyltransferase [Candidatus Aminicenantes bacterium]
MTTGDLPEVMAIEQASFPNPWSEVTFRGEIQNDGISFPLVAVERAEKRVVGYIIYWKIQDEIQINNIAVHPDFRGLGVGKAMMRNILDAVRAQGAIFATLEVRISNKPARVLYEKLGFEIIGLRKDYYAHPAEDALVLGLNI